jgi:hypothetical protein
MIVGLAALALLLPCVALAQNPDGFRAVSVCAARANTNGDCQQDAVGDSICVEGVVIAWKHYGNRGPGAIYDPASGCCISIFDIDTAADQPIGTIVRVCGWTGPFNGLDEIVDDPADGSPNPTVTVLGSGGATPVTLIGALDIADGAANAEALESCLVKICGTFQATGNFGSNVNVTFQDALGNNCTVRIDGDTDIDGTPVPGGQVTVVGVLGQFDTTPTMTPCSGYQILPRALTDIAAADCATVGVSDKTWSAVKTIYQD